MVVIFVPHLSQREETFAMKVDKEVLRQPPEDSLVIFHPESAHITLLLKLLGYHQMLPVRLMENSTYKPFFRRMTQHMPIKITHIRIS